jgi:hypothetical protein
MGSRGIQYDSLVSELDKIPERSLLVCNLAIMNLNEKILILTYHVDRAHFLANSLAVLVAPYGKRVALLAGQIGTYYDSDILVGTRSKIGIGFDEKEIAIGWNRPKEEGGQRRINLVILDSVGLKIEQIAGRAFRAQIPVIIDIVDNHKNTKNHYSVRKKWYESRNGVIITVRDIYEASWSLNGPRLIEEYNKRVEIFTKAVQDGPSGNVSGKTHEDAHTASLKGKIARFLT